MIQNLLPDTCGFDLDQAALELGELVPSEDINRIASFLWQVSLLVGECLRPDTHRVVEGALLDSLPAEMQAELQKLNLKEVPPDLYEFTPDQFTFGHPIPLARRTLDDYERMPAFMELCARFEEDLRPLRSDLHIAFDFDGTLISSCHHDFKRPNRYVRRPGANELLAALVAQGNRVSIWTTANMIHVNNACASTGLRLPTGTPIVADEDTKNPERYHLEGVRRPDVLLDDAPPSSFHEAPGFSYFRARPFFASSVLGYRDLHLDTHLFEFARRLTTTNGLSRS